MKFQFTGKFTEYISTCGVFLAIVLLSGMTVGAQTKRAANMEKEFSVPCAKALQIGLDKVEELHAKDMKRRTEGETDSDTELLEEQGALKNYLACRRADTTAKLKKLLVDEQKQIISQGANARKLARMRVDLIYGVSFDEKFDDPVNYVITQKALALVEDYKGTLVYVYRQTRDSNALGNTTAAIRDEKEIGSLLGRIEKVSREQNEVAEFAAFKTAVENTLAEIKDDIGTEKVVTTAFIVRLLKMNLADEN